MIGQFTLSINSQLGTHMHLIGITVYSQTRWPRRLSRSAAARLLGLRVRIPPRAWMSVSYECCVSSSRKLCDGLITRPEMSYRVWCVETRVTSNPEQ